MTARSQLAHSARHLGTAAYRAARGNLRRSAAALRDALRRPAEVFDEAGVGRLAAAGQTNAAIALCEEFLARRPAQARARWRLAQLHDQRGDIEKTLACLDDPAARPDAALQLYRTNAELRNPAATPATLLERHRDWVRRFLPAPAARATALSPRASGRLRVGAHWTHWDCATIKYQFLPIVRHLRARGVEVHGFSPRREPAWIARSLNALHDTRGLDAAAFTALARGLKLDVLLELHGLFPGHRFASLAQRCAPVQISYLNYTSTCAVPNVDYVLADALAAPAGSEAWFTEKIWRLPGCFFCFDYRDGDLPVPDPPPLLQNKFPTFGCLGSALKINADVIALWSRLLQRVPAARLLVMNRELSAGDNRDYLRARFAAQGIEGPRLELRAGGTRAQALAAYAEVDVSLDTFPYNGGNTIAESLWQGVPVVTLKGRRFSSCYGASLLAHSGLAELVAETPEQFLDLAAALVQEPAKLAEWRRDLRPMCVGHGFSDSAKFAENLHAAFQEMVAAAPSGKGGGHG